MRHLVACGSCRRQLDAGGRAPGEVLRCSCGALVEVPPLLPHDAAVVRCSACGAPRLDEEAACRYCGSSFTVHERDLDTVCPGCMARVSGSARFCSHCGGPILVDQAASGAAGGPPLRCPACVGGQPLSSRRLGGEPVAVSECVLCAGVWVEPAVFEILAARARHEELSAAALEPSSREAAPAAAGRLYRPCAVCGALMNRQNFGRKSGVIVDVCRGHGIWFDDGELPRILAWIQHGGEQQVRRLEAEEAQAALRQRRLDAGLPAAAGSPWLERAEPDFFEGLANLLEGGVRHLFHRR